MFSRIEFFISETIINLRRHPAMAFAAIICTASALFAAGIVGLAYLNATNLVDNALGRVRFVVFFQPETSRQDAWAAFKRLRQMDGVAEATFVPKEKAWRAQVKNDPSLAKLVGANPLPDCVNVQAVDVLEIPALTKALKAWPEVDMVRDAPDVNTLLQKARRGVRDVGLVLAVLLGALSLVIIHHTIELTQYARRKEMHIMALVGATPTTIATPFLLEGIIYGLLGGGVALGALTLLNRLASLALSTKYHATLLQSSPEMSNGMLLILGCGVALGLIGSTVSIFKYLGRPRSKMTNA